MYVCSHAVSATLIHSRIFPHIVSLNASHTLSDRIDFDSQYVSVNFRENAFGCSRDALETHLRPDGPSGVNSTALILSQGCFVTSLDSSNRKYWRICPSGGVSEYEVKDGKAGVERVEARTLVGPRSSATFPNQFHEAFTGLNLTISVKYICPGESSESMTVQKINSSSYEVSYHSTLSCGTLSNKQRQDVIKSIPKLSFTSSNKFWTYIYKFPDEVYQIHEDPTGDTPNEFYPLGNQTDGQVSVASKSSMDPDNPYIHPELRVLITNGSVCDKHNLTRQTRMHYRCPSKWSQASTSDLNNAWVEHAVPGLGDGIKFKARISNVYEPDYCEYVFVVESTALCADTSLLPSEFHVEPSPFSCTLLR
jgi:hypothetical protein